jgi:hypothetical protein
MHDIDELAALARRNPTMSRGARLVFVFVHHELWRKGTFPSPYLDLPGLVGTHASSVYRYMHELEAAGEMTKGASRYWRSVPANERLTAILPRVEGVPF